MFQNFFQKPKRFQHSFIYQKEPGERKLQFGRKSNKKLGHKKNTLWWILLLMGLAVAYLWWL